MEFLILLNYNERENEEKRRLQQNLNIIRRNLRDTQNFDIEENAFKKLYRLSKATMELIGELLPYMPSKRRSTAIPQYILDICNSIFFIWFLPKKGGTRFFIVFFVNTGFPEVIGTIDGTHIAIFSLETEREHLFINRKLYHFLNVMIVSSYNAEILAVNGMHGERTHNSRVFRSRLFHLQNTARTRRKRIMAYR